MPPRRNPQREQAEGVPESPRCDQRTRRAPQPADKTPVPIPRRWRRQPAPTAVPDAEPVPDPPQGPPGDHVPEDNNGEAPAAPPRPDDVFDDVDAGAAGPRRNTNVHFADNNYDGEFFPSPSPYNSAAHHHHLLLEYEAAAHY
ncbi:hypothetical protein B0H13DRAFT_2393352 [Mycena leptocephala]|nr:hypothetical protein B0H13DRAFT_2393352 [Mycena leptocephala]